QVAGDGAEHAAEGFQDFFAQRALARQAAPRDLRRAQRLGRLAAVLGQGTIHQLDPGAGQEAFGRDVLEFAPRILQDRHFGLVEGREAHMAAFAAQRGPAVTVRARDQARYAQAGTGADQADGFARKGRTAADLLFFV